MQSEGIIKAVLSIYDDICVVIVLRPALDNWDWQVGEKVKVIGNERKS